MIESDSTFLYSRQAPQWPNQSQQILKGMDAYNTPCTLVGFTTVPFSSPISATRPIAPLQKSFLCYFLNDYFIFIQTCFYCSQYIIATHCYCTVDGSSRRQITCPVIATSTCMCRIVFPYNLLLVLRRPNICELLVKLNRLTEKNVKAIG